MIDQKIIHQVNNFFCKISFRCNHEICEFFVQDLKDFYLKKPIKFRNLYKKFMFNKIFSDIVK